MFQAEIICDSIGPDRIRLATGVFTYPRFIHSEVMTHRDRARNAASSRAIPWSKLRARHPHESDAEYIANMAEGGVDTLHPKCMKFMIMKDPVIPIVWGAEQKGMQTGGSLDEKASESATAVWLAARDQMVEAAEKLAALGVHKSLCNRLTEPWMWITVVMSATEWNNFFRLRCHPDAEVHFQKIAGMMRAMMKESTPVERKIGDWHRPFIQDFEVQLITDACKAGAFDEWEQMDVTSALNYISAGRCARVSYLTHEGKRDWKEDVNLCKRLIERPDDVLHASPLEHVAMCTTGDHRSGPFRGWKQLRKLFPNENVEG